MNKKLNLEIGTKFSKWKIFSNKTIKKNNITHWECICECGIISYIPLNNLMNGSSTQCKNCSIKESGLNRRKGFGNISGQMWSIFKSNASKSGMKFNIRIEDAWEKFIEQQGKCALSNIQINLSGYQSNKNDNAVLVLINPDDGYNKNNIMWVDKKIGKLKSNIPINDFLMLIDKIYKKNF